MLALIAATISVTVAAQEPPIDWKAAERRIRRLPSGKFTNIPAQVREDLSRRGCTIRQVWNARRPHNIIRSDTMWAALCSIKGSSSILVYRGTESRPFARLNQRSDAMYLQAVITGEAGFSRKISAISANDVRHYCKLWNQHCPKITHFILVGRPVDRAAGSGLAMTQPVIGGISPLFIRA